MRTVLLAAAAAGFAGFSANAAIIQATAEAIGLDPTNPARRVVEYAETPADLAVVADLSFDISGGGMDAVAATRAGHAAAAFDGISLATYVALDTPTDFLPGNRVSAHASSYLYSPFAVIGDGILYAELSLDGNWDVALDEDDPQSNFRVFGEMCIVCTGALNGRAEGSILISSLLSQVYTRNDGMPGTLVNLAPAAEEGSYQDTITAYTRVFDGQSRIFSFRLDSYINNADGYVDFSKTARVRLFTDSDITVTFDDPTLGVVSRQDPNETPVVPLPFSGPLLAASLLVVPGLRFARRRR